MQESEGNAESGNSSSVKRSKVSRRTIVAGAAWATPVVMLATSAPAFAASPTSGLVCPIDNKFYATNAGGQFLSGSLLGLNLANIAEVAGLDVHNTPSGGLPGVTYEPSGAAVSAVPTGRTDGNVDAYLNPLQLSVLNALTVDLGPVTKSLGELLSLAETGAVNQYGQAVENGYSRGFSGLVANTGGVTLSDAASAPDVATVDLKTIVGNLGGTALAALVDPLASLNLKVGAVAGNAELDSCNGTAARDYYLAKLRLIIGSQLLSGAVSSVDSTLDQLETTVNGLADTVLSGFVDDVVGLVGRALGTLGLGNVKSDNKVTIDLASVRSLLTGTLGGEALTINLTDPAAMLSLDLDPLVGGLNGKAPNTELLINSTAINGVVGNIGDELDLWTQSVTSKLLEAKNLIRVQSDIEITLLGGLTNSPVATVKVKLDATLESLLNGTAVLDITPTLLPGVTGLLATVVNGVLSVIAGLATGSLKALLVPLGNTIDAAVVPLLDTVGSTLAGVVAPITTLVEDLLGGLFGQGGAVSLLVNVQTGPYDVAALNLGVLPTVANGINVTLAKAYAGPNTAI